MDIKHIAIIIDSRDRLKTPIVQTLSSFMCIESVNWCRKEYQDRLRDLSFKR